MIWPQGVAVRRCNDQMQQSSKWDAINIMCLTKAKSSETYHALDVCSACRAWDRHSKTRKKIKMFACHIADPSAHLTTASSRTKPTVPQRRVSSQWEREKCGRKEASPLLVHPLTSICAITPFDTWFHVTRRPKGWTTKTRNRGNRYKWPPSGLSFHPVEEDGESMERERERGSIGLHFCTHTPYAGTPRGGDVLHSIPDNDGHQVEGEWWLN